MAGCEAAQTAQGACSACMTGMGEPATRKSGIFGFEEGQVIPSTYVCEANAIGEAAECGTKADNLSSCLIGACDACYEGDDIEAVEAAVEACEAQAIAGPCATFVSQTDCETLLKTPENVTTIESLCGDLNGETATEADFKKAAAYVCGSPS